MECDFNLFDFNVIVHAVLTTWEVFEAFGWDSIVHVHHIYKIV